MHIAVIDAKTTLSREMEAQEIIKIEIVVCEILIEQLNIVNSKSWYVKPTSFPILTDFCIRMTGIEQKEIDHAKKVYEVISELDEYLLKHKIVGWCSWDNAHSQFIIECRVKGIANPFKEIKHFDLKKIFSQKFGWRVEIARALQIRNVLFERSSRSGNSDAENLVALLTQELVLRESIIGSLKKHIQ